MTVYWNKARGRWMYNFVRNGERHAGYCVDPATDEPAKTKTDAKRIEEALKVEVAKAQPAAAAPSEYTVARMIAAYTTRKQGEKDWPNKTIYIREMLTWFGAGTAVREITEQRIWDYIAWAREQPVLIYRGGPKARTPEEKARFYAPAKDGRKRADSTINRYLICLGEALRIVHGMKDAAGRPLLAEMPKVPRLDEPEHLPRPVSDDHLKAILSRAPQYLADGVLLVRMMGFRKAEVFSLTVNQVDLQNRGVWLEAESTKANRAEFVPANEEAMGLLRRLVAQANERKVPYLFAYQRGKPKDPAKASWLPVKDPRKAWKTACRKLGIEHRFHDTKASYVTAVAHVAPAAVTQQLARHKSYETTRRYLRVADEAARRAVEAISMNAVGSTQTASTRKQESQTAAAWQSQTGSNGAKEKAPEPLSSEAFPPVPAMVGATGFEPATPRPPEFRSSDNILKLKGKRDSEGD
jgi:integrase